MITIIYMLFVIAILEGFVILVISLPKPDDDDEWRGDKIQSFKVCDYCVFQRMSYLCFHSVCVHCVCYATDNPSNRFNGRALYDHNNLPLKSLQIAVKEPEKQ